VQIRPATTDDSPGIARVQVDSYRTAYAGILPQPYLDLFTYEEQEGDWRALISEPGAQLLYVAHESDDSILGYALGAPEAPSHLPYDSELIALHVRPGYHGRGIGRSLISAMARALSEMGCRSLMLWVLTGNPARGFYERLGGKLITEQRVELGKEDIGFETFEVAYGWPDIEVLCTSADPEA
jgi:ribosomal protein S18 acetylase RimI-like enzyme